MTTTGKNQNADRVPRVIKAGEWNQDIISQAKKGCPFCSRRKQPDEKSTRKCTMANHNDYRAHERDYDQDRDYDRDRSYACGSHHNRGRNSDRGRDYETGRNYDRSPSYSRDRYSRDRHDRDRYDRGSNGRNVLDDGGNHNKYSMQHCDGDSREDARYSPSSYPRHTGQYDQDHSSRQTYPYNQIEPRQLQASYPNISSNATHGRITMLTLTLQRSTQTFKVEKDFLKRAEPVKVVTHKLDHNLRAAPVVLMGIPILVNRSDKHPITMGTIPSETLIFFKMMTWTYLTPAVMAITL